MTETMRAIEITKAGGPEVLQPTDRPMPQPAHGQVVIKVAYAGALQISVLLADRLQLVKDWSAKALNNLQARRQLWLFLWHPQDTAAAQWLASCLVFAAGAV